MPYLGKQSEQVGVSIQKYEFLQATDTSSGTTSFSVPSDAGDHVNVWLNGVLLVEGGSNDYTTTNTTVVFGTAPADGDIVRIDVVESFALPDALKSSGDTMTGALKLDGGIKQQTSQDLSGTYAYHQLMLSDAFTVAGDVTISDNLVLAKLSDDSNAITISNDTSTRTITGTGSLEASTLAQTPNASLTGMTGEIGSTVTGGLSTMYKLQDTAGTSTTSTAGIGFGTVGSQEMVNNSSIQIIIVGGQCDMEDGARKNAYLGINWKWDSTFSSTTDGSVDPCAYFVGTGSEVVKGGPCVGTIIKNTSGSTKTLYFRPHIKSTNASYTAVWGANATYYPINYLITYLR